MHYEELENRECITLVIARGILEGDNGDSGGFRS